MEPQRPTAAELAPGLAAKGPKRPWALASLALISVGLVMAGCSEEPLPQAPIRSDDCLRNMKLDQLGEQLKLCDRVVAAFPTNPAPLNDRYLLRSLSGPQHERSACADILRATALAKQAKPASLDPQLRAELKLRLALCQVPAKTTSQTTAESATKPAAKP